MKDLISPASYPLRKTRSWLLLLTLTTLSAAALGQGPPFLTVTDSNSDSTAAPVLKVQGGSQASTQGVEVTSQSTSTSSLPNFSSLIGTGFGGALLLQASPAVSGTGQGSPFLCTSGNQWDGALSTPASVAAVWCLQVDGGSAATPTDSPDVIEWTRPFLMNTYGNPTNDLTMMWPASINLAARGQMTVGPAPTSTTANVSALVSTFTGEKTSNVGTMALPPAAGPVTIEPGQLTFGFSTGIPYPGSLEGALQILQSYISSGTPTVGLLACPSGTPQTVMNCTSTGAAENWVGVFNSIQGAQGISITPLRYGRVPISSFASGLTFANGDFVCKDDATGHGGYVIDNISTPCPIGESIGIAVGEVSAPVGNNLHLVDLTPEASVTVTTYWTNGPIQNSVTIAASNKQYVYGLIVSTPVVAGHVVLDVATQDPTSTNLYSVGIFNSAGSLIAHISPQAFTTAGVQNPIAFQEGTVTLPPGKYYLGLTGEATVLKLSSIVTTLIPLPATAEGTTTGGAQIASFTPPSDSWVAAASSEPAIALAP